MASNWAMNLNASVATSIAGMPRFSISTVSWRLHDVQDPQSPLAASTAIAPELSTSKCASLAEFDGPSPSVPLLIAIGRPELRELRLDARVHRFEQHVGVGLAVGEQPDAGAGDEHRAWRQLLAVIPLGCDRIEDLHAAPRIIAISRNISCLDTVRP